jgi:hypothetical protein
VDNYTETALSRLLSQFDGSGDFRSLVSSYVDQVQDLEDVGAQMLHDRNLDAATGDRLDGLGEVVKVPRGGRDDETYRRRLQAELAVLTSQGSTENLIALLRILIPDLPDGETITVNEYYPKSLTMQPVDWALEEDPETIALVLRRAVSAATRIQFIYTLEDDATAFTLSSQGATSETSSSLGLANNAQSTGGKLAGVE